MYSWQERLVRIKQRTRVCLCRSFSVSEDHYSCWALTVGVIKETLLLPPLTEAQNNGRKRLRVFRRWTTHKHIQAGFIRLALRVLAVVGGPSISCFYLPAKQWQGLCVPTLLMTQNLWAATNAINQYTIQSRMEVVQTHIPGSTRVHWQQHHHN